MHYVNPVHKFTPYSFVIYFKVPTSNVVKREFWICHSCFLSVRPPVRTHGRGRVPLDGFPWNSSLGTFIKNVYQVHSYISAKKYQTLYMKTCNISLILLSLRITEHDSTLFRWTARKMKKEQLHLIFVGPCIIIQLIRTTNVMQHVAFVFITLCGSTLQVSGALCTHHQECIWTVHADSGKIVL